MRTVDEIEEQLRDALQRVEEQRNMANARLVNWALEQQALQLLRQWHLGDRSDELWHQLKMAENRLGLAKLKQLHSITYDEFSQ